MQRGGVVGYATGATVEKSNIQTLERIFNQINQPKLEGGGGDGGFPPNNGGGGSGGGGDGFYPNRNNMSPDEKYILIGAFAHSCLQYGLPKEYFAMC